MDAGRKRLWDMKLHEVINPSETISILRVPDGWIYTIKDSFGENQGLMTSTFVPLIYSTIDMEE